MPQNKDNFAQPRSNTRTSLRRKRRTGDPMDAYDRLPTELRAWLSQAALPWSPRSALRVWRTALKECGNDHRAAQLHLSHMEAKRLQQDAGKVWGVE